MVVERRGSGGLCATVLAAVLGTTPGCYDVPPPRVVELGDSLSATTAEDVLKDARVSSSHTHEGIAEVREAQLGGLGCMFKAYEFTVLEGARPGTILSLMLRYYHLKDVSPRDLEGLKAGDRVTYLKAWPSTGNQRIL